MRDSTGASTPGARVTISPVAPLPHRPAVRTGGGWWVGGVAGGDWQVEAGRWWVAGGGWRVHVRAPSSAGVREEEVAAAAGAGACGSGQGCAHPLLLACSPCAPPWHKPLHCCRRRHPMRAHPHAADTTTHPWHVGDTGAFSRHRRSGRIYSHPIQACRPQQQQQQQQQQHQRHDRLPHHLHSTGPDHQTHRK